MVRRGLVSLILLVFMVVVAPGVTAAIDVETFTSERGDLIHHFIRADLETAVPPQDVLVLNEGAFGQLPKNDPAAMKTIVQFFDRLPEQVNLHVYRGQDGQGNAKFGRLKTKDRASFLRSLEGKAMTARNSSRALRNLVEQWPGEGNRPGTILLLTKTPSAGAYEISPDFIQTLADRKIVVHHLATIPSATSGEHSTDQLTRISGGQSITTGDVIHSPRLPGSYKGDTGIEQAWNTLVEPSAVDTNTEINPGALYRRALSLILPVHAYNPGFTGKIEVRDGPLPAGYAWTGRMPLVISSTPPVEDLALSDGGRHLDSVSIPPVRPEALSGAEITRMEHLKRLTLARRRLIHGLDSTEQSWLSWLEGKVRSNRSRPRRLSTSGFVEFLTGRVAIGESFQLAGWRTTDGDSRARTVPIERVDGPELQHLDYNSMMTDEPDTHTFPLTNWAPPDMAVLSFPGVDAALASGELFEYWSSDIVRNYMDETGGELVKKRLLDRLGIKMNRDMKPFYDAAVGNVGFFVNEPSLGATQDVALVMSVKNRELVETRFEQIRSGFRERYPGVSRREVTFDVGDTETSMTVFQTPDRRVSSHVWFHDGGVVVATSKRSLKRIARVKMGEGRALADQSDVQYLSQSLDKSSGYLVVGDSFVSKVVNPAWRMKYDRRARCLRQLDRLTAQTTLHRRMVGTADRSPKPGLCSPDHAVKWKKGRWVSPVYGHRQFATPIAELSISKLTEREHTRYRQFAEQYQNQWEQAVDPIGISLDVSSGTFVDLETVILPLVNQSQYDQLLDVVGESVSEPMKNWQSLPSRTVFGGLFANPFARTNQDKIDTATEQFRQWEQYKQRLRERLDWPEDEPMLDWLGREWGVVSFDLAPEDLAGLFSKHPFGAMRRLFSEVPIALYTDVTNEARANHFLNVVKETMDRRGRSGLQLRKQQTDDQTLYRADLFSIPIYIGVRNQKLFLALDREFLVPLENDTLADRTELNTMSDRFHRGSQGLFFFQLGRATGLKRFINPILYPVERRQCRRERARYDRRHHNPGPSRKGPFEGEWFRGPRGQTFCRKHSVYTAQSFWERLLATGQYPVLSEDLPIKQKIDQLNGAIISFEISPVEYSVIVSLDNPLKQ